MRHAIPVSLSCFVGWAIPRPPQAESGLSGTEFASSEGITRDCLYQRKLRARLEVLERLDAMTAAYLYGYGFERISIRRGETRRIKTVRAQRRAA